MDSNIVFSTERVGFNPSIDKTLPLFANAFFTVKFLIDKSEAINIHRLIYSANEDNLKDDFETRNRKQKDALKLCNNLKADILVAKRTYHFCK